MRAPGGGTLGRLRASPSSSTSPAPEGAALSEAIAELAGDAKALDPVELDLRGVLGYTDYFLVCGGNTERQTKAIAERVQVGLKRAHGLLPRRMEGHGEGVWILMDYGDVILHVFTPEAREHYRLEQLWGEGPRRSLAPGVPGPPAPG